jgi:spermidine synthase
MRTERRIAAYPLFFLSGAAGLGCQMVWVRMFAAGLGQEVPALLGVTSAFLGGLAVGAWAFGRRIGEGANGARWYGGLELAIGVWSVLSSLFIPAINRLALSLTGPAPAPWPQWLVVFALPFLALLPATAAMGATLPAMDRFLARRLGEGRHIGGIYAANTFGAVAGTLASVFVLMPALGFRASLLALAVLNLVCGVIALAIDQRAIAANAGVRPSPGAERDADPAFSKHSQTHRTHAVSAPGDRRTPGAGAGTTFLRLGLTIFFTGLLGIGFELAGLRVLSQVLENTVYTYAAALAIFLMGTAAGATLYQRFGSARAFATTTTVLLGGVATAGLAGVGLMRQARPVYQLARDVFGDTLAGVLVSELVVAALAFGLPTLFMGATFSHLVQGARAVSGGVGRATALNALGCAWAAIMVGVLALPALGTKWTLISLALGYLLLIPGPGGVKWLAVPLLPAAALAVSSNLRLLDLPPGAEVVAYREGVMASVAVVRTADGHRSLRVNNRLQMGGTAAALAQRRQAHIPLLLHPDPKRALFLGPGTGITLGAAAGHPGLRTDGVELVPEILDLAAHFEPENEGLRTNPSVRLHAADARRFVRTSTNCYDVIVADLFHPAQDGAGFLYTREHFQAIRQRLHSGGLFCQWLPLHQLDEAVLHSIVRTFTDTFADTRAFLLHFNVDIPALALLGAPDPIRLPGGWFEQRLADAGLRERLRGVGLERPLNLLGCFAASPQALRRFAGDAPASTDNHPVVLFAAPRFTIQRDAPPHALLLTFLERCRAKPEELAALLSLAGDPAPVATLADFLAARDLYLTGLVEEADGRLSAAIESYLRSARRSLHFTPAYARCVTIIQMLAGTDYERARQLYLRLEAAQPAQPLGRRMLGPLFEAK